MSKKESADDERWRAQQDARTLAQANAIQNDPERFKKAIEAAKDLTEDMRRSAKETGASADAMEALASKMYPTMNSDIDHTLP